MTVTAELSTRVRQCVSEAVSDCAWHQLADTQKLADLGLDSLDRIELLFNLEAEFSIGFDSDEEKHLTDSATTVLDLVKGVEQSLQRKGAHA
jgi:acyl carrier protein